jgi:hypothetical protein
VTLAVSLAFCLGLIVGAAAASVCLLMFSGSVSGDLLKRLRNEGKLS